MYPLKDLVFNFKKMKTIAIIGGGFSGTLIAIHLLNGSKNVSVKLINCNYNAPLGPAYSTKQIEHLLNVPAGKMSAFPDQPGHFINWLKKQSAFKHLITDTIEQEFIPRLIYGFYLNDITKEDFSNKQFERITAKAINVNLANKEYEIILDNHSSIQAEQLVLAVGNFLPANPKIKNVAFFGSRNYFQNPWTTDYLENLSSNNPILLIGSGLTMVDCVLSLKKNNFAGKIVAVSPRGYSPESHIKTSTYPDFYIEIENKELSELFKIIRRHITIAKEKNMHWQSVIDAVRPYVQKIWISLSQKDRQQFVSHLRHIWGVARHRLPKKIYDIIDDLKEKGQLEIIGGRLQNIIQQNNIINVDILLRKNISIRTIQVARVVNCTGPQENYAELNDELIKNLLDKKLITTNKLNIGIQALPDGRVLNAEGEVSKKIYTIGSSLRAVLWETTAIPELRVQASAIAKQIIENIQ